MPGLRFNYSVVGKTLPSAFRRSPSPAGTLLRREGGKGGGGKDCLQYVGVRRVIRSSNDGHPITLEPCSLIFPLLSEARPRSHEGAPFSPESHNKADQVAVMG